MKAAAKPDFPFLESSPCNLVPTLQCHRGAQFFGSSYGILTDLCRPTDFPLTLFPGFAFTPTTQHLYTSAILIVFAAISYQYN